MDWPVIIVDYDPRWPGAFADLRAQLAAALGPLMTRVEHIGSTSVPGLAAKPIIDVLAGVRRMDDADAAVAPLVALGFRYKPEHEAVFPERRFFDRRVGAETPGVHIHMVEEGGAFWRRHLAFRDYLRAHPETAREYEALKRALAAQYRENRGAYTDAKTEFIRRVETLAGHA